MGLPLFSQDCAILSTSIAKDHMKTASAQPRNYVPQLDSTDAENYYYVKQMDRKTLVTIVFKDGEELHGKIEWYDKGCIKLQCRDGRHRVIYRHAVRNMRKKESDPPKKFHTNYTQIP